MTITFRGGPLDGAERGMDPAWSRHIMVPIPCETDPMGCFGWAKYERDTEETAVFLDAGWPEKHRG